MIIDRIKWAGEPEKHMAKGLGVILAWGKARERAATRARVEARRATTNEPPPLEESQRLAKMLAYRKRNNAAVADKRPDDKLWDLVASSHSSNFLPYIPLEKVVTHAESMQRTKKISKDEHAQIQMQTG